VNAFTLNVDNWSGTANLDLLLTRLGDSVLAVTATTNTVTMRDGDIRTIPGFRIRIRGGFDGMRNTVAHSHACNCGFIASCD
jgi:hypothetical protein